MSRLLPVIVFLLLLAFSGVAAADSVTIENYQGPSQYISQQPYNYSKVSAIDQGVVVYNSSSGMVLLNGIIYLNAFEGVNFSLLMADGYSVQGWAYYDIKQSQGYLLPGLVGHDFVTLCVDGTSLTYDVGLDVPLVGNPRASVHFGVGVPGGNVNASDIGDFDRKYYFYVLGNTHIAAGTVVNCRYLEARLDVNHGPPINFIGASTGLIDYDFYATTYSGADANGNPSYLTIINQADHGLTTVSLWDFVINSISALLYWGYYIVGLTILILGWFKFFFIDHLMLTVTLVESVGLAVCFNKHKSKGPMGIFPALRDVYRLNKELVMLLLSVMRGVVSIVTLIVRVFILFTQVGITAGASILTNVVKVAILALLK